MTILAPCVLPILPIIIGWSLGSSGKKGVWILLGSLAGSILLFTLLLQASTILIGIPRSIWTIVSGSILIFFGLITLFPSLWDKLSKGANNRSKKMLSSAGNTTWWKREMFLGAALGPVFASCSPTYSLILATILPASFVSGLFYLLVYIAWLILVLSLVALLWRRFTKHIHGLADPRWIFKRSLGVIFLIVGAFIVLGWDKDIEAAIIDRGYFWVTTLEENLVEGLR